MQAPKTIPAHELASIAGGLMGSPLLAGFSTLLSSVSPLLSGLSTSPVAKPKRR